MSAKNQDGMWFMLMLLSALLAVAAMISPANAEEASSAKALSCFYVYSAGEPGSKEVKDYQKMTLEPTRITRQ